jgi:hypothetical protein
MAQQQIGTGSAPGDGTGDALRVAFGKVNAMFSELYALITTLVEDGPAAAWDSITGKPAAFPPEAHTHEAGEVEGLEDALAGKADASHVHAISQVTGLEAALEEKASSASVPGALSDLVDDVDNVTGDGTITQVVALSQEDYDAIADPSPATLYIINA